MRASAKEAEEERRKPNTNPAPGLVTKRGRGGCAPAIPEGFRPTEVAGCWRAARITLPMPVISSDRPDTRVFRSQFTAKEQKEVGSSGNCVREESQIAPN